MNARDELHRRDEDARLSVQTCFDRPIVLEAGAGTGKTAALVARIVVWSAGPGWDRTRERLVERGEAGGPQIATELLSRVVAITFTEAAAAEMSDRVLGAFGDLARGVRPLGVDGQLLPSGDELVRRGHDLVDAFDHLTVRTIHAFCRRLLARFPLEAGLHPAFEVDADESAQDAVVREVVEEALRDAYRRDSRSPLFELAARGDGPPRVEEGLTLLVLAGADAGSFAIDPLRSDRVAAHFASLSTDLERVRHIESGALGALKGNTKIALEALDLLARRLCDPLPTTSEALELFCDQLREDIGDTAMDRLKKWSRSDFTGGERDSLGGAADDFVEAVTEMLPGLRSLHGLAPRRLDAARRALAPLLERVHETLRLRGAATYGSLLTGVRDLLAAHPGVCNQIRRELDQLLVDEFQDTDAVQCGIVHRLALEGPEDERPGLFLVGDPKQSIYGWRSADLYAYDAFVEKVVEAGGAKHSLSVNFRSVAAILDEVDRAIAPIMEPRRGLQPKFERLLVSEKMAAQPGFEAGDHRPVEHWVSWKFDPAQGGPVARTRVDDATAIEARALARDLRTLHDEHGVPFGEVGILFRGVGDLDDYLSALREFDVPYVVERDRSYYRRREVIEAAAWIRCVLDPGDPLALLTMLRSSAVGVPDAALIPLWTRGLPRLASAIAGPKSPALREARAAIEQAAAALPAAIPGLDRVKGWPLNLLAALEALARLRESFEQDPADVFVERMRALTLLEVTEAARYLGAYRAANLERLFRELAAELAAGGDVQALLRRLRVDVERAREAEEERPKAAAEDAAQVMTIHKSKGLDFEHVYLVQLHKGSGGGPVPTADFVVTDAGAEYSLFGVATLGYQMTRFERSQVEAAERVRTLYVAMTRAKQRLVMLGAWSTSAALTPPKRAGSYVALLEHRGRPTGLESRMANLASEGKRNWFDDAFARWWFPDLPFDKGGPQLSLEGFAKTAAGAPSWPDPDEIRRQQHALEALCEVAGARMERERSAPASQESHALLRELLAERHDREGDVLGDAARGASAGADGRPVATAAGTAIHRVLEDLDLVAPSDRALEAARLALPGRVASLASSEHRAAAQERAAALLETLASGPLLQRLRGLADHIVARELPIWLAPAGDAPDDPVDFVAGAIDLVYRDPDDGVYVVADYKTDHVATEAEIAARADVYASQGRSYARALQEGLGLDEPPRIELWFLHPGRIVTVA